MGPSIIIYNPGAGTRKSRRLLARLRCLRNERSEVDLIVTRSEDHLKHTVIRAFPRYENIILSGGDTTFTIALNAILENRGTETEPADPGRVFGRKVLGILPRGTANDIARELGIRSSGDLLAALKSRLVKRMDLGLLRVNGDRRWFAGSVSLGLGVLVNRDLEAFETAHPFAARYGFIRNFLMGLVYIRKSFRQEKLPVSVTITLPSGKIQTDISLLVLMNGSTYAGGLRFNRKNGLFTGQLGLVMVKTDSFADTLRLVPSLLLGRGDHQAKIECIPAESGSLNVPGSSFLQFDGEVFKADGPVDFKVYGKVLPVLIGPGSATV